MVQRHNTPIRGLMATQRSPLFQGRFGRLFRSLPPATFGRTDKENEDNIAKLGAGMSASFDPPTLSGDNHSVLNLDPTWKPTKKVNGKPLPPPDYNLKDFVNYALGKWSTRTRADA
jgi:hypothetical protein